MNQDILRSLIRNERRDDTRSEPFSMATGPKIGGRFFDVDYLNVSALPRVGVYRHMKLETTRFLHGWQPIRT